MIVRMKEIWLFTLSGKVDETVQELGELGVVEIREINPPDREQIDRLAKKAEQAGTAISILESYTDTITSNKETRKTDNAVDPTRITERIVNSVDFRKRCLATLDQLQRQLKWYETWGKNTSLKDLKYLREKGIYVRLYLLDKKYLDALPNDQCIVSFEEKAGKVPVALFTRSESEKLQFIEEPLPDLPLAEIRQQMVRKNRQLEKVESYLAEQTAHFELLKDYHAYLQDRVNSQIALEGMGDIEGRIKYLKGFLPKGEVDVFKRKAELNNWGYKISEPENPEEVPVYIKNPKWVSMINPVMKFIDIVPGYKEIDVSIYFLVAFALFFAMLIGDAGYGAIFLLITFFLRKKLSPQMRLLIYVLSGTTIIWGVLSGTYFGSEQIAAIPILNRLIIPEISSFGVDNIDFMMHLTFLIGAIHLTVAHSIRAVQFINSVRAISEMGWIALVWGLFFIVETLVLGKAMPGWNIWLFVGGATLVALFSREGKTFFGSMLSSLGNLPLSLINGFSDIVSYVRLFAVGMATAMVASSFNTMILPQGVDLTFLEIFMAAIALLLGHGMNIILALMAVMVHGIRLNMLEFAGHLGVQFSGEAYQPFTLKTSYKDLDDKLGIPKK